MKSPRTILTKLSQQMDIPSHISAGLPYTTVQGFHEISIDLQRGLLAYSQTEISVAVPMGAITISGVNLHIRLMREGRITVCGDIENIGFSREKGR